MYKHEMPLNPETLREIGLLDIPRWYRDKYGVKSIHAPDNDSSTSPSQDGDGDGRSHTGSSNSTPASVHGTDSASRPSISEGHHSGNPVAAMGTELVGPIAPQGPAPQNSGVPPSVSAAPAPMFHPLDQQGAASEHEQDTVPKLPRIGTWGRTPSYSFENDSSRFMGLRRHSSIGSFGQASSISGVPVNTNTTANYNGIAAPVPQTPEASATPLGFPTLPHRRDTNPSRASSQLGGDMVAPIGTNSLRRRTPFAALQGGTSHSYPNTLAQSQSHNGLHALAQSQAQSFLGSTNSSSVLDLPYERFPFTRPTTAAGNPATPGLPAPGQLQQQQQQQQHAGLHRAQSNMSLNAFSSLKRTPSFSLYGLENSGNPAAPLTPSLTPGNNNNSNASGGFPGFLGARADEETGNNRGLRANSSMSSLRYPPITPGHQW